MQSLLKGAVPHLQAGSQGHRSTDGSTAMLTAPVHKHCSAKVASSLGAAWQRIIPLFKLRSAFQLFFWVMVTVSKEQQLTDVIELFVKAF